MVRLLFLGVIAVSLSMPTTASATTASINFDNLNDGDLVSSQYLGLTFANAIALSAGVSLNEFEFPPHSGTTVISDEGGPIRIDFATAASNVSGFFTYAEPLTLRAYDAGNSLIGTTTSLFLSNDALFGDSGSLPNELLLLAVSNIAYITINGDPFGSSFTLDDLRYSTDVSSTPVPEPSTLALLLGGLGLIRRWSCRWLDNRTGHRELS